ncbi:unnamed protein product [Rotaria sp. Silwood1]|nr:unnamed protein product [Rotaria sp. Silwood1]CAF3543809.1 unnamed protein product [Rotaria sp. Silwood1]CAF3594101.1 unnamed protein product [Rotaria sp. Silwood1]CAF4750656.1 unnamed protein product [Rotaria sp. Silwood1]CAF4931709.1 unnamed protein product [Rotaria sp. Silwood1]
MHCLFIFFSCVILFQVDVFAQLSSSSCSLLRTVDSLTTILPEIAQLAMRYYRAVSFPTEHHRQKRFLFNENIRKNGTASSTSRTKGRIIEQMIANTVQDVNFTNVAISILNNNETMNKLRKNIDNEAIIRIILHEIDYKKLGSGIWSAAENNFDLEHFIASVINITRIDRIHSELITNGTLPEWLLESIHPNLNSQKVQQIFSILKNVTHKFVQVLSKSERFDNYLFNMITQQSLKPLNNIIQGVQESKPKTFNQLIEIIINNVNQVAMEQITITTKQTTMKVSEKKSTTSTIATVDLNDSNDVKLMLYQWSIALDSMGQTVRIILKSLERLYCASLWE